MTDITLFGQIFQKSVKKHKTDKYQKGFDGRSHLISMFLCHFGKSKSVISPKTDTNIF